MPLQVVVHGSSQGGSNLGVTDIRGPKCCSATQNRTLSHVSSDIQVFLVPSSDIVQSYVSPLKLFKLVIDQADRFPEIIIGTLNNTYTISQEPCIRKTSMAPS